VKKKNGFNLRDAKISQPSVGRDTSEALLEWRIDPRLFLKQLENDVLSLNVNQPVGTGRLMEYVPSPARTATPDLGRSVLSDAPKIVTGRAAPANSRKERRCIDLILPANN
jgi:hypothetical protein